MQTKYSLFSDKSCNKHFHQSTITVAIVAWCGQSIDPKHWACNLPVSSFFSDKGMKTAIPMTDNSAFGILPKPPTATEPNATGTVRFGLERELACNCISRPMRDVALCSPAAFWDKRDQNWHHIENGYTAGKKKPTSAMKKYFLWCARLPSTAAQMRSRTRWKQTTTVVDLSLSSSFSFAFVSPRLILSKPLTSRRRNVCWWDRPKRSARFRLCLGTEATAQSTSVGLNCPTQIGRWHVLLSFCDTQLAVHNVHQSIFDECLLPRTAKNCSNDADGYHRQRKGALSCCKIRQQCDLSVAQSAGPLHSNPESRGVLDSLWTHALPTAVAARRPGLSHSPNRWRLPGRTPTIFTKTS